MADWDVSRVTDFSTLFWEPASADSIYNHHNNDDWVLLPGAEIFNADLSRWTVTSRATTMRSMFHGATSFNQPIMGVRTSAAWDVSMVTDMSHMFQAAKSFDQPILSVGHVFNTERVTDMSSMFRSAQAFNNGHGSSYSNSDDVAWNVAKVQHFQYMFHEATSFQGTGAPMGDWDVSGATDNNNNTHEAFGYMFQGANAFNGDISDWEIPLAVGSLAFMFQSAKGFNQDLSSWKVQHVTDFTSMLEDAESFQQTLCWNLDNDNSSSSVETTNMLAGTKHAQLDPNTHSCFLSKPPPKHSTMLSSSSQLLLVSMIVMGCVVTAVLLACSCCTAKTVVKRRRQKRRFVFRSNKVEEEQVLFHENNDAVVEIHDNSSIFTAGDQDHDYFDNEGEHEEGEISFIEDDEEGGRPSLRSLSQQESGRLEISSGSLFDGPSSHQDSTIEQGQKEAPTMPLEDAVAALTMMMHQNDALMYHGNPNTSSDPSGTDDDGVGGVMA